MAVAGHTDVDIQSGPLPPGPAARARGRRRPGLRRKAELALLLGPALVLFAGFVLVPIVLAAYYSLYNWSGFGPLADFAGLHNYRLVLADPVFRQAFGHNLIIVAVLSIVIQLPLSLGHGPAAEPADPRPAVLRTLVFAPFVLSEATTAVMWLLLLQPGGFVDQVHEGGRPGRPGPALAGQPAPRALHDVRGADLEVHRLRDHPVAGRAAGHPGRTARGGGPGRGAAWQATWRITLPLLGPTIRIWLFLSIVGSLQLFDLVWIMTGGGPANASSTMVTYLIHHGFQSSEFGYGSAVAVILFVYLLHLRAALPALRAAPGHAPAR